MPLGLLSLIAVSVLGTSFLSGVFGMAGGMVLMGVLVAFLPVAAAMIVHGTAQMTSNGWRAFLWRRHIDFRIFRGYCVGLALASVVFIFLGFVPDRALVLIVLGALPFIAMLIPARHVPQATSRFGAEVCGLLNTALQFIAGVSGPLLDVFFVRTNMDRRAVVATKAACQTVSHMAKLVYFSRAAGGGDTLEAMMLAVVITMAVLGTSLSKFVLERMTDHQFRRWTQGLLLVIGAAYLTQGFYVLWSR
ncbi:sulfite exporter TauE/SafE family protein [Parapusillimonas granuli]|uniref:Probable membrane transporter protein n=1 Tax=Parapusillimonas granuli TaxID=380911 RepID=A0A853FY04_9BURK|nr:sulfite exporter TauE/SafE family protein [Parapusillimonas granuli]MBB5214605.1 putative membrane protein YfcA [Parapusillimonas granuli]MEB2398147.1 sulfite exporter TauE/SafE family protein [Alcaligenaceae bacterium]NYT48987.1 sulfite exporter TauE/SafE family protein [Parapusillimonas granuli]